MVVVVRFYGGIKLGTGGLVRAYGGIATECLRDAATCLVKSKVPIGLEVPFGLLGSVYHQVLGPTRDMKFKLVRTNHMDHQLEDPMQPYDLLQSFQVEDMKQDYDTGKDGTAVISFRVDYDKLESLETTIKATCSREIQFYK
ncbi:hypothetical protein ACLOJK_016449 [Asimina triloba]